MAMIWAFDVDKVAERSWIVDWIKEGDTVTDMHYLLSQGRSKVKIRDIQNFPPQRGW